MSLLGLVVSWNVDFALYALKLAHLEGFGYRVAGLFDFLVVHLLLCFDHLQVLLRVILLEGWLVIRGYQGADLGGVVVLLDLELVHLPRHL